jgi:HAD superfamily hydrolase (TIGR01509 family)
MLRAVIFDLDGVLVNTEPLKGMAHAETVTALGGRGDPAWYRTLMGQSHERVIREFMQRAGIEATPEQYDAIYHARYAALMRDRVRLNPGATSLNLAITAAGLRRALVTSSARWMTEEIVRRTETQDWFEVVITADDVTREKPDPEPYRKALAGLALDPDDAVAIEDSESGACAAVAAGLRVIGIRHEMNDGHDLSMAIALFRGLPSVDEIRRLTGVS